jgi:hypothetical protein
MFDELLHKISQKNLNSYIFLDSNFDLLSLHDAGPAAFLNSVLSAGYLQCINKATRMQNGAHTLLDQILTSCRQSHFKTGTIIQDLSDHFPTFILTPSKGAKNGEKTKSFRSFSEENLSNFKRMLNAANWDTVFNSNDVNIAYDAFWSTYNELFQFNFPLKKTRFNKNIHSIKPFMTQGLLKSRETKKNLYLATLTDNTALALQRYRTIKNLYFKTLRAMKKLHYSNKLEENAKNSKKTWDTINEVQGKPKKSENVDKININGTLETDPLKIAQEFNLFFTRVGKQISQSIPTVSRAPEDYINYNRDIPNMSLGNTTPEHIKKVISKFQPKTSCDVQGQSSKMIKFISNEIAAPLSHIFNLSLSQGIFPEKLKNCRVIPIFKSGDNLNVDNYRPISLLSSISKILEKIVAEKLISHLISNDLLYNHQYGFLPNKSTEQNLLHIVNYITEALNDGMYCLGVFLDLRKAFDVCSHDILLKKLKKMGIQGTTHKWLM